MTMKIRQILDKQTTIEQKKLDKINIPFMLTAESTWWNSKLYDTETQYLL